MTFISFKKRKVLHSNLNSNISFVQQECEFIDLKTNIFYKEG